MERCGEKRDGMVINSVKMLGAMKWRDGVVVGMDAGIWVSDGVAMSTIMGLPIENGTCMTMDIGSGCFIRGG